MCPVITEELQYIDFVAKGREMAELLKNTLGCQLVVALTHMRSPDDRVLASQVP